MILLLLSILLGTAFLQLFRLAQVRGGRLAAVGAINYAVAALVSGGRWWLSDIDGSQTLAVALGLGNGTLYLLHLAILLRAMKLAGLGLTTAVTNTSAIVPVIAAAVLWSAPVSAAQWLAIALMPVALLLMRRGNDPATHLSAAADFWLILSMLMQGIIQCLHKAAQQELTAAQQPTYNVCLFAAAMMVGIAWTVRVRAWPRVVEYRMGALIGAINAMTLICILLALRQLSPATFFTISGTAIMALNVLSGKFLWGETLRRRHWVGMGLAMLIVALAQRNGAAVAN